MDLLAAPSVEYVNIHEESVDEEDYVNDPFNSIEPSIDDTYLDY